MSREENQQESSSNQRGKRFEHSLSQWPVHFYKGQRQRKLAYTQPLYDEKEEVNGYRIIDEYGKWYDCFTLEEFTNCQQFNNFDVHIPRLYDGRTNKGFIWLAKLLNTGTATGYIANSSKTLVSCSYRIGRYKYKIVNAGNWISGIIPNADYIQAIRNVCKDVGMGTYVSPSGIGHALLLDCMYSQDIGKIYRPNSALRNRIRQYSSGGRADDFTLEKQYHDAWSSDRDNAYAASALQGVPTGRVGTTFTIGLEDEYDTNISEVEKWQGNGTSFCQARIEVFRDNRRKISPFYTRDDSGLLQWQTNTGTYTGYFWYPMLARCVQTGYKVSLGKCWIWTELDRFLSVWILKLIALRNQYKASGQELEESIVKTIIVSSIGRFYMSTDTLTLTTQENKQENDEPFLNLQAQEGESLQTPYYIHTEHNENANHLNQIASYIIMLNNVALTDYMQELEEQGNEVLWTNYDEIVTRHKPLLDKTGWKQKHFRTFEPVGKRSHDSVLANGKRVTRLPGKRLDTR